MENNVKKAESTPKSVSASSSGKLQSREKMENNVKKAESKGKSVSASSSGKLQSRESGQAFATPSPVPSIKQEPANDEVQLQAQRTVSPSKSSVSGGRRSVTLDDTQVKKEEFENSVGDNPDFDEFEEDVVFSKSWRSVKTQTALSLDPTNQNVEIVAVESDEPDDDDLTEDSEPCCKSYLRPTEKKCVHLNRDQYLCSACEKELMKYHVDRHFYAGEKSHMCHECCRSFNNKSNLAYHMRVIHRKFPCDLCRESFGCKKTY